MIFTLIADSDGIKIEGEHASQILKPTLDKDQTFVQISADKKTIVVNTSPFGERPLFFYQNRNKLIISNFLDPVYQEVIETNNDFLIDRTAIIESMIFDYPIRQRTLLANVLKAMPGKRYSFDLIKGTYKCESHFILPFDKGEAKLDDESLIDQATEVLLSLPLCNLANRDGDVLLPLSGGLDSRLLACLLSRNSINFNAVTFGPPESTERIIARRVAESLNLPLRALDLRSDYYKTYGDEVTVLTGGLSNHRHCHLYAVLAANGIKNTNIVHGYLGDVYAGASQPDFADCYEMSRGEALDQFLNHHVRNCRIWPMISQSDRNEIFSDLEEIMRECCEVNLPCHFDEYVHNVDRQFSLIANIFLTPEPYGRFIRPFASRQYTLFFNALPFEYRKDRRLYRKAALKLFPRPFAIGNQSQIFPENSLLGNGEKVLSMLLSGLSLSSFLLTKGKLTVPNPKGYERHRQILFSNLKSDFFEGIDYMSAVLGVDLGPFREVTLRNKNELTSQYRILSNSLEIKHIRNKAECPALMR